MGRASTVKKMKPEHRIVVEDTIRKHNYLGLDEMVVELEKKGIMITRSTLHRYLQRLEAKDHLLAGPDEATIITIVERGTGEVRVIKTSASASILANIIVQNCPVVSVS